MCDLAQYTRYGSGEAGSAREFLCGEILFSALVDNGNRPEIDDLLPRIQQKCDLRGARRISVRSHEIERFLRPGGPDVNETVANTRPRPRPCFDAENDLGGHVRFYPNARYETAAIR